MTEAAAKTSGRDRVSEAVIWRRGFVLTASACLLSYVVGSLAFEVRPGNAWGMAYGIGAVVLLLVLGLYGVRRRAMRRASRLRLGRARSWLFLHIYGGGVFLLLVLLHSGFRLPHGNLEGWLWGLALWTVVSGLVGWGLQQWIPRVLGSGLSIEVLYERIPELVDEIRQKAEQLVAKSSDPMQALYRRELAADLERPRRRLIYLLNVTGGIRSRLRSFQYLQRFLDDEEKQQLRELERLYHTKLEIDAHYTLQQILRGWLYAHLPVSLVLLIFVVFHVLTVFYY